MLCKDRPSRSKAGKTASQFTEVTNKKAAKVWSPAGGVAGPPGETGQRAKSVSLTPVCREATIKDYRTLDSSFDPLGSGYGRWNSSVEPE